MSYVGPLYIFSKYDKFMYLLSTIDGEVIETDVPRITSQKWFTQITKWEISK